MIVKGHLLTSVETAVRDSQQLRQTATIQMTGGNGLLAISAALHLDLRELSSADLRFLPEIAASKPDRRGFTFLAQIAASKPDHRGSGEHRGENPALAY
jgi:hypothetical protein